MKQNNIPVSPKITAYLSGIYGEEWTEQYCAYASSPPVQYIRVNTLKTTNEKLSATLGTKYGVTLSPVDGIPELFIADDPSGRLSKSIEHITGHFYIQSLSSALPVTALNPQPGENVLDLCAAPGSKTSFIAQRMNNTGRLTANEIQANRTGILSYNAERMGLINTGIMNSPGEWLSPRFIENFDRILVDVPCSGLGIVHKKGEVSKWWNEDMIEKLAVMQYKLLYAAIRMLKSGGELIYSTCTLSVEENEAVINSIMKKLPVTLEPVELSVQSQDGFTDYKGEYFNESLTLCRRIVPWEVKSEGFFVARLRKNESIETPEGFYKKQGSGYQTVKKTVIGRIAAILEDTFGIPPEELHKYCILERASDYYLSSPEWNGADIRNYSRIGIKIGSFDKYDNFIVHTNCIQFFAAHINKNIFRLESDESIRRYLDGGTIKTDSGDFKGQAAVEYEGALLGACVVNRGILKSRFPRAFRTQAIEL